MGQQEVYDFLKSHPDRWWTGKQIHTITGMSLGSVTASLKKLRRHPGIMRVKREFLAYYYMIKKSDLKGENYD